MDLDCSVSINTGTNLLVHQPLIILDLGGGIHYNIIINTEIDTFFQTKSTNFQTGQLTL